MNNKNQNGAFHKAAEYLREQHRLMKKLYDIKELQDLISEGTIITLPKGLTVDEKKLTREETWEDLFYPKVNFVPKVKSPLRSDQSFVLTKDKCDHTWQNYVGFTDSYDFCTKCDKKRSTK